MIIGLEPEVLIQKMQESRQEHQQKIKAMREPVSVGRNQSAINGMQQRTVNKRRRSVRHDEKQTWKINSQTLSGSRTADEKTTGKNRRKQSLPEAGIRQGRDIEDRTKTTSMEIARTPRVILCILLCLRITEIIVLQIR